MDNHETIFSQIATAQNVFGGIGILFGALVGVLMKIDKTSWMGWPKFFILTIINLFFGLVAYLVAVQQGMESLWPVIVGLIFGSLGEKGGGWIMDNFQPLIIQNIMDFFRWKLTK